MFFPRLHSWSHHVVVLLALLAGCFPTAVLGVDLEAQQASCKQKLDSLVKLAHQQYGLAFESDPLVVMQTLQELNFLDVDEDGKSVPLLSPPGVRK